MNGKEKAISRTTVLEMLEKAGTWVSGEEISQRLGVSRAAVGKHVTLLRNEGHAIEAFTRKGYRLLVKRDALSREAVAALLPAGVFGTSGWSFFETATSTNLVAARMAEKGAIHGHVVAAEKQTEGRGRKGRGWFSLPRGIQFSIVLFPDRAFWDAEAFTQRAALAVAEAITELTGLDAVFKMPNDVLINGKKIAGVLVETGYRGNDPDWAVIGIGCNVNALPEEFPESARDTVTSVFAETGSPVARNELLAAILGKLNAAYEEMRTGGALPLHTSPAGP